MKTFSVVRTDSKTGKEILKGIIFSDEEINIAIEKINTLHRHGFGAGLTEREFDIINSDATMICGQSRYGVIFRKKWDEEEEE